MIELPRLLVVSDRRRSGDAVAPLLEAAAGGATFVQLRERDADDRRCADWIERLRAGLSEHARLAVNGRPRLAARYRIGLHLPASDRCERPAGLPLVGRSVHDPAEARAARERGTDYLVAGTIYPTVSKPGHPGIGAGGLAEIVAAAAGLPVFAIGGLTAERCGAALAAGAYGVAVSGAVLQAARPAAAAVRLREALSAAASSA